MLVWIWGKGNASSLLAGVHTGRVTMEIGVEALQKARNRSTT